MKGEELYRRYSYRDYSGSDEDTYAQLLQTIFAHVGTDLFDLLERADVLNKKLSIIQPENSNMLRDEITVDDVELI
jgi:hypothetical protein